MGKFLDDVQVGRLWAKMKTYVDSKVVTPTNITGNAGTATKLQTSRTIDGVSFDGSSAIHHYGTCSTSGGTAAKTCSITGFSLVTGARVSVRFTYANSAASPTLNVNGTGAKYIYYKNVSIPVGYIRAYTVLELVYSGSYWYVVGDLAEPRTSLWTGSLYPTSTASWKYQTISALSNYEEIRVYLYIGDVAVGWYTLTRNCFLAYVPGYFSTAYNGWARVQWNTSTNQIGIYVSAITGWALSQVKITAVEGTRRLW